MSFRRLALGLALPAALLSSAALVGGAALAQVTPPAATETARAEADRLFDALGLPRMLGIMREEGLDYGRDLAGQMLGSVPADFVEGLEAIYDPATIEEAGRAAMAQALEGQDLSGMIAFFESETGTAFVDLELQAREAMLDPDVDAAAREAAAAAVASGTDRAAQLERFIAINDLVETNVTSAMNSNLAFYRGLGAGGGLPGELGEDQILADVWAQEPEIRRSTTEWLYAFLGLAYQPATDQEVEAYIDFSGTEAGQVLNRAMFVAFDDVLSGVSSDLGRLVAAYLGSQEL
ncbi:DUF2059 domain-containing protein [Wenxinia saemankumensis]|uniref:DUF2059 domain-containing protein n=1 Tax=Wenxinia saemankumensis TaxID=1447782 RepID=A0A1M6HJS1_9RHOB|nr:DUF2059 domain-containing protein [Wenxinia saemankumensis]SHJ22369.1 hypothetical protein SAMN05444417_3262 [Wenxinia saemankumensis]